MALVTLEEQAAVGPARSQLGRKNQILLFLGQTFGVGRFTSREVAARLGADFLYTSKFLSRMAEDRLLSVVERVPRWCGGYENSYTISARGFQKIAWLLSKKQTELTARPKPETNFAEQIYAAHYLLHGRGTANELLQLPLVRYATCNSSIHPVTDELGMLLVSFDPSFQNVEICGKIFDRLPAEISYMRTTMRASHLQELGYAPKDMDMPYFVANAMLRGSTEQMILLDLSLRRSLQLKTELEQNVAQKLASEIQNHHSCTSCRDYYQRALSEERHRSFMHQIDNIILKDQIDNIILKDQIETLKLKTELANLNNRERMRRMLTTNLDLVVTVCKQLDNFKDCSLPMMLMKSFINECLLIIYYVNHTQAF